MKTYNLKPGFYAVVGNSLVGYSKDDFDGLSARFPNSTIFNVAHVWPSGGNSK